MMCLWARGQGWNPDSPAEPSSRYRLSVKAVPAEAATTSGSGHYTVNSRVTVSATATAECWQFRGWTDSKDQPVSDLSWFTYTTTNAHETLTAHYERVATSRLTIAYDPSTVYKESTSEYKEGTIVHLEAGTYSNFTFVNWTNSAGDEVSRDRQRRASHRPLPLHPRQPRRALGDQATPLGTLLCRAGSGSFVLAEQEFPGVGRQLVQHLGV